MFLNTYEKLSVIVMVLTKVIDEKPDIPLSAISIGFVMKELVLSKAKFESRLYYLNDMFPDFIAIV